MLTCGRTDVRTWVLLVMTALLAACDSLPGKPTEADRTVAAGAGRRFRHALRAELLGLPWQGRAPRRRASAERPSLSDDRGARAHGAGHGERRPRHDDAGFAASAGGMLADDQVGIIVDGMISTWGARNLQPSDFPPYTALAPGIAGSGESVYAARCASCHGADGTGGPRGGSVVDGAYLGLVSDQALRLAVICGRIDLGMPDWRAGGQTPMSEQEISDVVAWMVSKRPQFP
jgi:mono/diheme cytochrome c family protein